MPAQGAIYIQRDGVDLHKVFDGVRSDGGLLRNPTFFDVPLGSETIRFNIMPSQEIPRHIQGLLRYIESLDEKPQLKRDLSYSLSHTKVVLGVVAQSEFEDNPRIWEALFQIADAYDGFVFVYDSVLLPSGTVLVGPLKDGD